VSEAEQGTDSTTVQTPTGTFVIQGEIYVKWRDARSVKTPDGDDAQAHLGYPLGSQTAVPPEHGGGAEQLFQRGMIVERQDGRVFVVYGAIYDHYLSVGGTRSALGPPTSDEGDAVRGGRVTHFQNGDIYWHVDFGARDVYGARRDRYATRGYPFTRSWIRRVASLCRSSIRRIATRFRSPSA
jgi:LGFP repeat